MKNYKKPAFDIKTVISDSKLSSLNDWLQNSGSEYANAGITTYVLNS